MTITAGFRVQDGILLCADTMYTSGMKSYATKITKLEVQAGKVAFALAGTEDCCLMLIQACQKALAKVASSNLSMEQIEDVIRKTLRRLFNENELQDDDAQFLIAAWTAQEGIQLLSTRNGVVVERDTFECKGSGAYLANYLIQPAYRSDMDLREVIPLATQTLAAVKAHDEGCGGQSELIVLRTDGFLSAVAHDEISASEKYIGGFEKYARRLMLDFANPQSSEDDFRKRLDSFVETITIGREGWLEDRRKAVAMRKLLEALFPGEVEESFVPATPEAPKHDPKEPIPSEE